MYIFSSTEYPRELNGKVVITAEEAKKLMKHGWKKEKSSKSS
jgi:hypothetical protein